MLEDCIELRHHLHQHPELSGNEQNTHNLLASLLERLNPSKLYKNVGGYGLVAVFEKAGAKRTVAFRADIDALPINETLQLLYCSGSMNVAHKCGHDGHTAILMRFAEKISQNPPDCNIVLIFQAEEETGYGAKKIMQTGLLQSLHIDMVFGFHNLPQYSYNKIVTRHNTFAAASCGFVAKLVGRQTHAAHPENGINPGLAVAELIAAMDQHNASHCKQDSFQQSTLIYTHIGEKALGTSAGDAEIIFTLRAFSNKDMAEILDFAKHTLAAVGKRHRLETSYELQESFPAVENSTELTDFVHRTAVECDFEVEEAASPFRWSEDFSQYLAEFKGCFFGIGSGLDSHELHHPDYDFPDRIIEPAAEFLSHIAHRIKTL